MLFLLMWVLLLVFSLGESAFRGQKADSQGYSDDGDMIQDMSQLDMFDRRFSQVNQAACQHVQIKLQQVKSTRQ